ncbi:MAG: hypothetical protein IJT16_00260 [Lachnospiraceae bacterium]|nr:hypothetical protein [Lachnospiraceae bacterium]
MDEIRPCIVVIAYNREKALARLLSSIGAADYPENTEIPLIISIDKSDNEEVANVSEAFDWRYGPKRIEKRPDRLGLKRHVLLCGDYSLEYGSAIVLEDDLYVSPQFYRYAVSALAFSKGQERLGGISLYNHLLNVHVRAPFYALDDGFDNYYFQFASSWGQAYTKEQWKAFRDWLGELEGAAQENKSGEDQKDPGISEVKNNRFFADDLRIPANVASWSEKSWLKYHIAYLIDKDMFFLYPRVSLTTNFMSEGEHSRNENQDLQVPLLTGRGREYRFSELSESEAVYDAFFENLRLKKVIAKTVDQAASVMIDLYGFRARTAAGEGKRFADITDHLLTSEALPYKLLKSYGRRLRPIDLNIILDQSGEDFFLYDVRIPGPAPRVDPGKRYLYDYRALSIKKIGAILKTRLRNRKHIGQ